MGRIAYTVLKAAVLLGLWLLFAGSLDPQELLVGAVVAGGIALLTSGGCPREGAGRFLQPRRWLYGLLYVPYLLWAIVRSNLDVALRVLHPRLPIRPGIVKVRTRLRTPLARLVLANSITLTPGTLSVDVDGEDLYVHWLEVHSDDIEAATNEIVAGFERYLEVILD